MKSLLVALGLSVALVCSAGHAQQPASKITSLHKSPVSGQPDKEFILLSIDWPEGVSTPAHTHLGDEYGSVIEGSYSIKQGDGEWKTLNAGESWHIPAGVVHESKPAPTAKAIHAFIVEKGKPLINPFKKP